MKPVAKPIEAAADLRQLIHSLNQAHRRQWERAERLQAELNDIQRSRAWRLVIWLRGLKKWLRPPVTAAEQPTYSSQELTGLPLTARGKVSIVIPFRDQPGLLKNLMRSLRLTAYKRFEVVLVDNGSACRGALRYLARLQGRRGIRIVAAAGDFNFARLCNLGAKVSSGDFLLFLNNDIEVRAPHWLEELLRLAALPQVGIAGATLLYPDGTIQHAGLYPADEGRWTHAHRGLPGAHPGNAGELRKVRTVPAVTGACLMLRRELFLTLGGFREDLPITGNDVELCLRVRKRGLLVAISPHARLLHFESLSRGYAPDSFRMSPNTDAS